MRPFAGNTTRLLRVAIVAGCFALTAAETDSNMRAQGIEWVQQFGAPGFDIANAVAVSGGATEFVYVAGRATGALPGQVDSGGSDAFLRKYRPDGTEVWTRQFGTSSFDEANDVAVAASGNVYVGGRTGGTFPGEVGVPGINAFVRKYDANGNVVWTRQFSAAGPDIFAEVLGIALDNSENVYVAGDVRGTLAGSATAGGIDAYLRKYDRDGNVVWTRQLGTAAEDRGLGVAADAAGHVYVSGRTAGAFPGFALSGGSDGFVRKYDPDANEEWTQQFGTAATDFARGIAADATGVYVVGLTSGVFPGQTAAGDFDVFARKYEFDGTHVWTRQFGSSGREGQDESESVAADGRGNIYVVAVTEGTLSGQTSAGRQDLIVRKYDAMGSAVWDRQLGTSGAERGQFAGMVAASGSGASVYLAGYTDDAFAGHANEGTFDAFVAKLPVPATGARIESFDNSRAVCSLSFVSGPGYGEARRLLAAQGFTFGAGVPVVTEQALEGVDIFVINLMTGQLSADETRLLEDFVTRGGAVLDTRNMFSPSLFGVSQITFDGIGRADIINAQDPHVAQITAGVSSPVNVGASSFLATGSDPGIPFLREIHGEIARVFPPNAQRAGRFVVIGDEELFINSITCPGALYIGLANNQRLLGNLFAWLRQAPGVDAGEGPPVAESQSIATQEDTPVAIALTGRDPQGDALTFTITRGPAYGTLSGVPPALTYTPDTDFNGMDTFDFTVGDGAATSEPATVTITINAVNDAPAAADDAFSVDEDAVLDIVARGVLANDSDIDGDSISAVLVTGPAHGALALNADGSFRYTPSPNYNGPDRFTYTASDGRAASVAAAVTLVVNPVNDPPTAIDDVATTVARTPVTIPVLTNDRDVDGDVLAVTGATPGSNGTTVVNADSTVTYTPNPPFTGIDTFTYALSDGQGGSATAQVSVTVSNPREVTADLHVTVLSSPNPVTIGHVVTHTITVRNGGPDAATGVVLTDDLDYWGNTILSVSNAQCSPTITRVKTILTCPLGTLAPGASATVAIRQRVDLASWFSNIASVTANERDPAPADNRSFTRVKVDLIKADLALTLTDSPDPIREGQTLTYTYTVRNLGPGTASGAGVNGSYSIGLRPVSIRTSHGSCPLFGYREFQCVLGNLSSGSTAVVTVTMTFTRRATPGGNMQIGTLNALGWVIQGIGFPLGQSPSGDPVPSNDRATARTQVSLP